VPEILVQNLYNKFIEDDILKTQRFISVFASDVKRWPKVYYPRGVSSRACVDEMSNEGDSLSSFFTTSVNSSQLQHVELEMPYLTNF
jgi:hypothetical protein